MSFDNEATIMKLALALDLRRHADGAIEYLKWLESHTPPDALELRAVHAEEDAHVRYMELVHTPREIEEFSAECLAALEERTASIHLAGPLAIERGEEDSGVIEQFCKKTETDLLVIGRAAITAEFKLVRLGTVARQLLRKLPVPVCVVPPDLESGDIGPGPIVVATDAEKDSLQAGTFAREYAALIGRRLLFVHVTKPTTNWHYGRFDTGAIAKGGDYFEDLGRKHLDAWLVEHGLDEHESVVRKGGVSEATCAYAREVGACAIVTGSRKLNAIERLFSTSVGSEIAANADRPVLVVPPSD
jgi:nucleotide-binding universal stress UspA family protein